MFNTKVFNKVLVANRGEIACRIIKTCKKLGIKTVAVYSDLDAKALHVRLADEAVHLGAASSSESYLSIPRIMDAIKQTGANAVHPGYGFLSENPAFVKTLEEHRVVFIGPRASAIAAMGDKIQSKLIAKASGVHCIPGYDGEIHNVEEAVRLSREIGYPVMIKASAGGGGKGMRIAWNDAEVKEGFKLAKQESKSSFGDDRMLIEKYIDNPRHIEIQVLGDNYGHVVYLPERECSIQRRNQKVVEESPSVHLDPITRRKMGEQAVALAKHVGYNSAGTVEFLVDSDRNFYFLEMNTRLQVEHPITEYVTGLDLVEHMLYSAANRPLALRQDNIQLNGWAMEARVYAEDPKLYLPSAGRLLTYQEPHSVRCDSGFTEGSEMSVEYDPLICKLATYGSTRQEALQKMLGALDEYVIKGVTHNIPLLRAVFAHPRFQEGSRITTHFLAEEYPDGFRTHPLSQEQGNQLAAVASALWLKKRQYEWQGRTPLPLTSLEDIWVHIVDEQSQHQFESHVKAQQKNFTEFEALTSSGLLEYSTEWPLHNLLAHTKIDNKQLVVQYLDTLTMGFRIQYQGNPYRVTLMSHDQHQLLKHMKAKSVAEQSKIVKSPMPGRIVSVAVKEGDEVPEGVELVVIEAMKMQNSLKTSHFGKIKKVYVHSGHTVKPGQTLIEFYDQSALVA
ncbi:carbamoyl-phosphate synthase L chain, ATP binding domain-containing protein [Choanephora cucurbitarum]|nr:carbamoyl-phosphate synthase L chain, ATP binding domain-containing protein [Choanephora cucurbitarum]